MWREGDGCVGREMDRCGGREMDVQGGRWIDVQGGRQDFCLGGTYTSTLPPSTFISLPTHHRERERGGTWISTPKETPSPQVLVILFGFPTRLFFWRRFPLLENFLNLHL